MNEWMDYIVPAHELTVLGRVSLLGNRLLRLNFDGSGFHSQGKQA